MRNRRLADAQAFAQLADANAGTLVFIAAMSLATAGEAKKDRQAVRVRKGLENGGQALRVNASIVIDMSQ
jgi:hypothetical protein